MPLGLSPRLLLSYRYYPFNSPVVAHRLLSTSRSAGAAPTSHHSHGPGALTANNQHGNPYKDGPSAIDKAVHIFFFTEILRGVWRNQDLSLASKFILLGDRNVDRTGELLQTTIHYYVPL